ncbi:class I ribonucleotide reductase maintenance protein YfaE [Cognaticolwellia mytili]|uniref:class I ribonucleotide reductase maintenance protein YfaE n=1 Tax=Cognaticolwellia mytili TaxID=1888913 RepID=UPI000A16F383|nr:class I ribonucleotide reductase maintenance protein YfaE [Cognaticolwellia mytili]
MPKDLNSADEEKIDLARKEKSIIKISVANQEIIYLDSHRNLLECLESADVEVHYHCRDGYCGACRVALKSGEINYPQGEPLAFIGDGEILPCCCIPCNDITIEVD